MQRLVDINEVYTSGQWYYAQALGRVGGGGFGTNYTIIIANNKKEATEIGKRWIKNRYNDLHLYKNNYKKEARAMLLAGNYLTN